MAEAKRNIKKTGGRKSSSARPSYPNGKSSGSKKAKDWPRWVQVLIATVVTGLLLFIAYHIFLKKVIFRFAVCDGVKAYQTCLPKGYAVFGIDISRHQGDINWEELEKGNSRVAPIKFVYMKATEGSDYKDTRFNSNWEEAKEHGFARGAYHYFTDRSPGDAQATMFIKNVELESGDLPPMIDIEEEPKDKAAFSTELKKFILRLEEHYGVKPIIYSYIKFHRKYLDDAFFNDYELWIAHYYVERPEIERMWKIWQFTDIGRIPGINTRTDINALNGGIETLQEMLIK
jgi:lysozyme